MREKNNLNVLVKDLDIAAVAAATTLVFLSAVETGGTGPRTAPLMHCG